MGSQHEPAAYIAKVVTNMRAAGMCELQINTLLHELRHNPPQSWVRVLCLTNELLEKFGTPKELATVDACVARLLALTRYSGFGLDDDD